MVCVFTFRCKGFHLSLLVVPPSDVQQVKLAMKSRLHNKHMIDLLFGFDKLFPAFLLYCKTSTELASQARKLIIWLHIEGNHKYLDIDSFNYNRKTSLKLQQCSPLSGKRPCGSFCRHAYGAHALNLRRFCLLL